LNSYLMVITVRVPTQVLQFVYMHVGIPNNLKRKTFIVVLRSYQDSYIRYKKYPTISNT